MQTQNSAHAATSGPADEFLLSEVRGGNLESFGLLYERYINMARAVAYQHTQDKTQAEDLAAEAFVRILQALKRGKGPRSFMGGYLATTLAHLAQENGLIARREIPSEQQDLESMSSLDETVLKLHESDEVVRAFTDLPERWQAVLWMTEVENKKPREVAQTMSISANAVSALATRAREGLREGFLRAHQNAPKTPECAQYASHLSTMVRGSLSKKRSDALLSHLSVCSYCTSEYLNLAGINKAMRVWVFPVLAGLLPLLTDGSKILLPFLTGGAAAGGAAAGAQSTAGFAQGGGGARWNSGNQMLAGAAALTAIGAVAGGMALVNAPVKESSIISADSQIQPAPARSSEAVQGPQDLLVNEPQEISSGLPLEAFREVARADSATEAHQEASAPAQPPAPEDLPVAAAPAPLAPAAAQPASPEVRAQPSPALSPAPAQADSPAQAVSAPALEEPATPTQPLQPLTSVQPAPLQPAPSPAPVQAVQPKQVTPPSPVTQPVVPVAPVKPSEPVSPVAPEQPETPKDPGPISDRDMNEDDPDLPVIPLEPETPLEPSEPVVPAEPSEPTEPSEPIESETPSELVESVTPAEPSEPVESETPVEPSESVEPVAPVEPSEPVVPAEPTEPSEPLEPETPSEPLEPVAPAEPSEPVAPLPPLAEHEDEIVIEDENNNPAEPAEPSEPSEPVSDVVNDSEEHEVVLEEEEDPSPQPGSRASVAQPVSFQNWVGSPSYYQALQSIPWDAIGKEAPDNLLSLVETLDQNQQASSFVTYLPKVILQSPYVLELLEAHYQGSKVLKVSSL